MMTLLIFLFCGGAAYILYRMLRGFTKLLSNAKTMRMKW